MAYVMGSVVVSTGQAPIPLFNVPPGLCNVTFWNNALTGTVYVGTSTAVTSNNGLQCHSIPTNFFSYISNKGATFYGTAATQAGTVNYIIVTNQ
jgi:hypothetical protein